MSNLLTDFRVAFRALFRQPVLSFVALFSLALGIGANTAIFSLVKGVLLNDLPYPEPAELAVLWEQKPQGETDLVSPPTFLDWRATSTQFQEMAAFRDVRYGFETDAEPLMITGLRATPSLFAVLEAGAVVGRTFTEDEGRTDSDKVALLSDAFWRRHFEVDGAPERVLGSEITLDGLRYVVVGVMGEAFTFPPGSDVELWTPLSFDPNDAHGRSRRARALRVIGRLENDTTLSQAQEEMSAIAASLASEYPDTNAGWGVVVESAHEQMVANARPAMLMLLAAVGFLLLIVCANVANLMLARLTTRRREVALRAALGAGRFALARQVLAESFLLSTAGACFGLVLAFAAVRTARQLPVSNVPRLDQIGLDAGVLLFTAVVSVAVGLAFGILPAIRASRPQLVDALSENTRGGSISSRRVLSLVVVAEVALAVVLLVGAGLTLRSFGELMRVDPGFRPDHLVAAQLFLPQANYPERHEKLRFFNEVLERTRALPGVISAAAVSSLPMHPVGIDFALPFSIDGRDPQVSGEEPRADIRAATEGYFETMRIPLLRGRVIDARDREDAPHTVVINETLARRHFPNEDPLGEHIINPHGRAEVVGVVADVHHYGLDAEPRPELYLPFSQNVFPAMAVVARTESPPMELASNLRRAIWDVDPSQAIFDLSTMDQALSRFVLLPRLSMMLLVSFAAAALVLAAIGIYGVIAYSVSQRTTEMGLRMALGAKGAALTALVVRDSMRFVALGLAIGLAAAFAASRFFVGHLYGVSAMDPAVYLCVAVVLAGAALLASFLPARHATRVDPIEALRVE